MSNLTFMTHQSKGLARAFAVVVAKYGDTPDADTGEVWQYMATVGAVHQFRHRSLAGKRLEVEVPVAANDFEAA